MPTMRFLAISCLLVGACCAQQPPQPHRRFGPQQPPQQQDDQYDPPPQQSLRQPQQAPPPQQADHQPHYPRDDRTTPIPIIRFSKEQGNDGSYKASYETGNSITAEEEGYLKELGPDPDSKDGELLNAQVQQGSYSYTAPDGTIITVNYVADETGFHPSGDHLPTPPPVSAEVQKGLDLIYAGIKAQQEADARDGSPNTDEQEYNNNGQYRP